MISLRKFAGLSVAAVVAVAAVAGGKWYSITALDDIDPQRGLYGMADLEIWIELNTRMPTPLRVWACDTLLEREARITGKPRVARAPYGCDAAFGLAPEQSAYDSIVRANLDQITTTATPDQKTAALQCLDAKVAALVTPDDIAAVNTGDVGDPLSKVIMAVSDSAQACRAELGL